MTKGLKEHLIRCEKAMHSAKPILGKYEFPVDPRTSTVIGFISMLMEHQESIVILEVAANQALHLRSSDQWLRAHTERFGSISLQRTRK